MDCIYPEGLQMLDEKTLNKKLSDETRKDEVCR